jgi:hypothetical protein
MNNSVYIQRLSALAPDSLEWLQLEEIMADDKRQNKARKTYKLVCKDLNFCEKSKYFA